MRRYVQSFNVRSTLARHVSNFIEDHDSTIRFFDQPPPPLGCVRKNSLSSANNSLSRRARLSWAQFAAANGVVRVDEAFGRQALCLCRSLRQYKPEICQARSSPYSRAAAEFIPNCHELRCPCRDRHAVRESPRLIRGATFSK